MNLNWKKIYPFIFLLMAIALLLCLSINDNNKGAKNLEPEIEPKNGMSDGRNLLDYKTPSTEDPSMQVGSKDAGLQYTSGPTKDVPWGDDLGFCNAIEMNDTHTLLAAFCTVLKNPLPGEEFNVHFAASLLSGITLKPGEVFSQNSTIGPYTQTRGYQKGPTYIGSTLTTTYGGGVCKISSTLYNIAVLSNLEIIERHAHSMPVPYVPYGQDATVAYGAKDFKFKNTSSSTILIWALGIENTLYIAFYGNYPAPKIEWEHETLHTYKAPTIYRINNELPLGEERIILEGMDGAVVKSWVNILGIDGEVEIKQMGTSYYTPMSHIIEKGG